MHKQTSMNGTNAEGVCVKMVTSCAQRNRALASDCLGRCHAWKSPIGRHAEGLPIARETV